MYTRELKNNKKIEEQEPARTIDKHHSAIEVRKKKKNNKKHTLVLCGNQERQLKRYL